MYVLDSYNLLPIDSHKKWRSFLALGKKQLASERTLALIPIERGKKNNLLHEKYISGERTWVEVAPTQTAKRKHLEHTHTSYVRRSWRKVFFNFNFNGYFSF
jgi:hypothetical protein